MFLSFRPSVYTFGGLLSSVVAPLSSCFYIIIIILIRDLLLISKKSWRKCFSPSKLFAAKLLFQQLGIFTTTTEHIRKDCFLIHDKKQKMQIVKSLSGVFQVRYYIIIYKESWKEFPPPKYKKHLFSTIF